MLVFHFHFPPYQSTDSAYVVGGDAVDPNPAAMLIYKLLQLNCLAVYWQSNDQLFGTSPPDNWMVIIGAHSLMFTTSQGNAVTSH